MIAWNELDHAQFMVLSNVYLAIAGALVYPADLVSTRLQADSHHQAQHGSVRLLKLTRDIIRTEGVLRGLYRGFGTSLLATWPGQWTYYTLYELVRQRTEDALHGPNDGGGLLAKRVLASGVAGVVAEAISALVFLPADLVIQRIQVTRHRFSFTPHRFQDRRAWQTTSRLIRAEGLGGLLRGYVPYVLTFAPDSAVWWMAYEGCRTLYSISRGSGDEQNGLLMLGSSILASLLSTTLVNPLDVARTRLQLLEAGNPKDRMLMEKGFWHILRESFRQEGWHGMFKGLRPRLLVTVPGSAVTLLGYEWLKEVCSRES